MSEPTHEEKTRPFAMKCGLLLGIFLGLNVTNNNPVVQALTHMAAHIGHISGLGRRNKSTEANPEDPETA